LPYQILSSLPEGRSVPTNKQHFVCLWAILTLPGTEDRNFLFSLTNHFKYNGQKVFLSKKQYYNLDFHKYMAILYLHKCCYFGGNKDRNRANTASVIMWFLLSTKSTYYQRFSGNINLFYGKHHKYNKNTVSLSMKLVHVFKETNIMNQRNRVAGRKKNQEITIHITFLHY
jgi:hypothetical protein